MSKFSELIDQVSDEENHSLSAVLLKAKVLAHQFRSRTFRQWINSEIDGYKEDKPQLPDYRIIRCNLQGHFVGTFQRQVRNVPLSTSILEPDMEYLLAYHPMLAGITYIEDLLRRDGPIGAPLDIQVIKYLRTHGEQMGDMVLNYAEKVIPRQALAALLTSVRSRLLDFLLELRDKYPELEANDSAAAAISESDIDTVMNQKVYHNCTVFEGTEMRDNYQAGQAGAMGPGAKVENVNFFQVLRGAIGNTSLADLANELEQLRTAMLAESKNAEQDEAVSAVAEAEASAKKGDAKGVLAFLKRAGSWAMDQATRIGTELAVKAIEKSMEL
jgi:hypothetical protein